MCQSGVCELMLEFTMTDRLTGIKQKSAVQCSGVGRLLYAMASVH